MYSQKRPFESITSDDSPATATKFLRQYYPLSSPVSAAAPSFYSERATNQSAHPSVTRFEDLSNELVYEIFDYFDAYELFDTFLNLNERFNQLLIHSSLPLKTSSSLSSLSSRGSIDYVKSVVKDQRDRLVSIILTGRTIFNLLLLQIPIDASFSRLQSIVIRETIDEDFIDLLPLLSTLPRLESLDIALSDGITNFQSLFQLIFQLPSLRHNRVTEPSLIPYGLPIPSYPTMPLNRHNSLEYLILNLSCTLHELFGILPYASRLRRLQCRTLVENSLTREQVPILLPHLETIQIDQCLMSFDVLEFHIKSLSPSIRSFCLTTNWETTYLDADRWKKLIRKYMPQLQNFSLTYTEQIYESIIIRPLHCLLHRFLSPFWKQKRSIVALKMLIRDTTPISISYMVHPYKALWYETMKAPSYQTSDDARFTSDHNDNSSYCRLDIEGGPLETLDRYPAVNNFIRSIFNSVPITDLKINLHFFSIRILIQLFDLLPALNSISIVSQCPAIEKDLSEAYLNMVDQCAGRNRITKVHLEHMTEIDEVHFLMHLCPRMTHLQVTCRTMADMQWVMEYAARKQRARVIPNLRILGLAIPQADENMVKILRTMVHDSKLLNNFFIDRVRDKIFISWNEQIY